MKKILLIYHSNICNKNCGINSYLHNFFKIASESGFKVDIFVPDSFDTNWDIAKCDFLNKIFLDDKKSIGGNKDDNIVDKEQLLSYLKRRTLKIIKKYLFKNKIEKEDKLAKKRLDWISDRHIERFKDVLSKNNYDSIIFSYAYYSRLADFIPKKIRKICSVSDFLSIQQMEVGNCKFGEAVDEEIEAINKFDKVFFISSDEMFFFSNFLENIETYYLPHYLDDKINDKKAEPQKRSIDILFLGSDNIHNIKGIDWFLKDVYPKIKKRNYKITIAGKITKKIDKESYPNIEFINYIENLSDVYNKTKLIISPLKSGTGIKIKIVEAMAYGLPIVCTSRSLMGFMEKKENGCLVADSADNFSKAIIHLLTNDNEREKLSIQSRIQFNKYFNREYVKKNVEKILN